MITGVILAHNEERHIVDCIAALRPHVGELLVIDTESTDRTVELARPLADRILTHPNEPNFDAIRNIAIPEAQFDWLWFVDADERIPQRTGELVNELIRTRGHEFEAINIPFKSYFCGQWMQHCGWWPGYTVCRVAKRGHFEYGRQLHSGVHLNGRELRVPPDPDLAVPHFSFRDLEHYVTKFNRYTTTEALQLKERNVQYDWKIAIHMMIHDLWQHYELNQAQRDGSLGWILTWMAGQYRWMSHTKLIDLQARGPANAPANLDEVLRTMEEELAHFRKFRPSLPLGVVLRSSDASPVQVSKRLIGIAKSLGATERDLAIEAVGLNSSLDTGPAERAAVKAWLRARRPRHSVGICCDEPAIAMPHHGDVASVLYADWSSNSTIIPDEWIKRAKCFDEIWVGDNDQKQELRRSGLAPEHIQVLPDLVGWKDDGESSQESIESAVSRIEARFCPPVVPAPEPSQIRVELEGELFAGHSFSNVNEHLMLEFAKESSLAVRMRRVVHNPTHDRSAVRTGDLLGYVDRDLGGNPQVTIRHAFPPNWTAPESGLWVHIQPWEFGHLPNDWLPALRDGVDEIWAPSHYVKRVYLESGISPDKIHVIPWGVDSTVFAPDAPPRNLPTRRTFRFLFVGGTIPRKGFDRLLEAYLSEFDADDDVCLVVKDLGARTFYAGTDTQGQIARATQDPRSPEIIYIDEESTSGQLASLYTACQVLVAPYRGEGFGLPVLEAMACGLAPIVPKGGATDDFVTVDHGYLLSATTVENHAMPGLCKPATELEVSIDELRRVMRRAATNRETTRSLGTNASQFAQENYSWARTTRAMTERLQSLVANGRNKRAMSSSTAICPIGVIITPTGDDAELAECLCRTRPFVTSIGVVDRELSTRGKQIAMEYDAAIVPDSKDGTNLKQASEWMMFLYGDEWLSEDEFLKLAEELPKNNFDSVAVHVTSQNGEPAKQTHQEARLFKAEFITDVPTLDLNEISSQIHRMGGAVGAIDVTVDQFGQKVRRSMRSPDIRGQQPLIADGGIHPYPLGGKGILIQLAVGNHQELMSLTRAHHQAYAARHGLEYLCVQHNPAAPKRPGWGKVALILAAMQMGFDRIVWLDADAVIVGPSVDLSCLVDVGIGMAQHPNFDGKSNHWNSGVIVVSHSAATRRFFEAVNAQPENDSPWMEQLAINDLAARAEFSGLLVQLSPAYNSTPGAVVAKAPVVCAAHGLPHETRRLLMAEWMREADHRMKTNGSLGFHLVRNRNEFGEFLNCRNLLGEAVEVGVQNGHFSKVLLDHWHGSLLHLVDPWRQLEDYQDIGNLSDADHELCLRMAKENLAPHQGRFRIHRMLSHQSAPAFPDCALDFVYIDANHQYSSALQDMRRWFPKVKPGGVLAGHDYLDGQVAEGDFGVKSAVRTFECETGLVAQATCEPAWPTWYFLKPN